MDTCHNICNRDSTATEGDGRCLIDRSVETDDEPGPFVDEQEDVLP